MAEEPVSFLPVSAVQEIPADSQGILVRGPPMVCMAGMKDLPMRVNLGFQLALPDEFGHLPLHRLNVSVEGFRHPMKRHRQKGRKVLHNTFVPDLLAKIGNLPM